MRRQRLFISSRRLEPAEDGAYTLRSCALGPGTLTYTVCTTWALWGGRYVQALDAEGFCDTTITAPAGVHGRGGLTVAGKSGAAELQRIGERAMSKNKSDLLVMRASVSFLRRLLRDEGFPVQLFAE